MSSTPQSCRIVVGITGGIAAYKTVELVRLLTREGYDVVPIMTEWATRFVGPLTLEALTGHQVRVATPASGDREGIEHISLIRSAELLLVAPLTANTAAKMVAGLADNFLTSTYLAHRGKTAACPAMNTAMLEHPATVRNLAQLEADGVALCYGDAGDLACGEVGAGRMAEPDKILDFVAWQTGKRVPALAGKKVLVTAGPTREDLDPVRFITNRSSGKMGIAVARAFRNAGAQVVLVCGPTQEALPQNGMTVIPAYAAAHMEAAVLERAAEMDVIVMAAAVADYRPQRSDQKLKKDQFDGTIRLERTTDILAQLGRQKPEGQILAGFAAESEHLMANALRKLERKNLDMIFANDISGPLGFGTSQNRLAVLKRDGTSQELGIRDKNDLAAQMVDLIGAELS